MYCQKDGCFFFYLLCCWNNVERVSFVLGLSSWRYIEELVRFCAKFLNLKGFEIHTQYRYLCSTKVWSHLFDVRISLFHSKMILYRYVLKVFSFLCLSLSGFAKKEIIIYILVIEGLNGLSNIDHQLLKHFHLKYINVHVLTFNFFVTPWPCKVSFLSLKCIYYGIM